MLAVLFWDEGPQTCGHRVGLTLGLPWGEQVCPPGLSASSPVRQAPRAHQVPALQQVSDPMSSLRLALSSLIGLDIEQKGLADL